jgi:anti-sigma regulatory factor (Ser/Thr protein kinase)
VALLVTELVTNAVVHGRSDVTVELTIAAENEAEEKVRISVGDDDSRLPRFEWVADDALGGRGLRLVQGLSDRFGVQERPIGKVVWCALDRLQAPEPYPPAQVPVPVQGRLR